MNKTFLTERGITRRELMRAGLGAGAAGLASALPLPNVFGRTSDALAATDDKRILVVFELSGGNDGLNTLVPYGDDAYYQARPKIGIPADELLQIDGHFGFNPGVVGFERLYKDGNMAIAHGCGYDNPSFSHFTSAAYWHTAAPNSGEAYGWVGRTADAMMPGGATNYLVNIDATQSLAVRSRDHTPVVFDDPAKFVRDGYRQEKEILDHVATSHDGNSSRDFLHTIAQSALEASALVREAWANYDTPIDYGLVPLDLDKVASLIAADMPTRLYYTSFRNNSFDTHVHQGNLHRRLLTYAADAVLGFMRDMERIGRADDVVMLIFSEFGRRVPENTSLGTDHGAANNMFVVGKPVKGGHYGDFSSLTELDDGDNLLPTTDFRRVYASIIENWLGVADSSTVLHGQFEPFDLIA
jgi:uncharacterized protein (DUF1501 family)